MHDVTVSVSWICHQSIVTEGVTPGGGWAEGIQDLSVMSLQLSGSISTSK